MSWQSLGGVTDPLEWAHRLREREESGEILGYLQGRYWREALGVRKDGEAAKADTSDH